MQYEFKIRVKEVRCLNIWEDKYLCICNENMYQYVYRKYTEFLEAHKGEEAQYVMMINLLNDNGEFERTILWENLTIKEN